MGGWDHTVIRTPGRCQKAQVRVVKAIKLFRDHLEPWIQDSDIQVVHLIRDPRAIIGSRATAMWARELLEAQSLCRQMQGNMALARSIPPDRYTLVRYEDMAENMVEVMSSLYHRLGLKWTEDIRTEVQSHTEGSADQDKDIYKTVRSKNYVGNNWEQNLSEAQVDLIERECSELMLEAGYQFKNHKRPKKENESEGKEGKQEIRVDKERKVTNGYGHGEGYSYST